MAEDGMRIGNNGRETPTGSFFLQLRPYCLSLLDLVQCPTKDSSFLSDFAILLRHAPSHLLRPCFDYTLFPLLMVLDASIACRSKKNLISKVNSNQYESSSFLHAISDQVSEGVIQCLEEVLKKCHLTSVDQMLAVMKKLVSGALLSPSEAVEEFREGIVRCLRALLLRLDRCLVESCICKQIQGLPAILSSTNIQALSITPLQYQSENECIIAFLQSHDASPCVGQLLSILIQIADAEAARGHHGSGKLRAEAFFTLRLLIAKVGTADALAFFLPGVVSGFAKVLHVSKAMISGAAGSVESIDNAVRGLSEFLMIALGDEENLHGLEMPNNCIASFHSNETKSTQATLESLRHSPVLVREQVDASTGKSPNNGIHASKLYEKPTNSQHDMGLFHVNRTNDWIEKTVTRVDEVLSATFPHLCVHPAKKVRHGLVDSVRGLLSKCKKTLKNSKLMFVECLCGLVCDDSVDVSVSAKEFLESFLMLGEKHLAEHEVAEIFSRLVDKLPRKLLESEEAIAVSHAQKLLSFMYYAGPQLVVDHLLPSPVTGTRFMDALALSLSHKSAFAGSIELLTLGKPFSAAYLPSVTELKVVGDSHRNDNSVQTQLRSSSVLDEKDTLKDLEMVWASYKLPRMPPWFVHGGGQKLYETFAGILRLFGLSIMADDRRDVSLHVVIEFMLECFWKLISELRMKECSKESWNSWYARSGHLLREASTAACILNEIMYGISDQYVQLHAKMFQKPKTKAKDRHGENPGCANELESALNESVWKVYHGKDARLIDCFGRILHEYLSLEVWKLPIVKGSSLVANDIKDDDLPVYFYRDTTMLHQVIIEGIGIFGICLGNDFLGSGFLHASLYLLLENLMCSSHQIRKASDAVLHLLSATSGHQTVGHFVVANADYIIDSLCQQLRHVDRNTHVPNVLASMLSYIGVAHQIFPLLEEPMRAVSSILDVHGRHQHPDLTIPFLKAVREIVNTARREASTMPSEAELFSSQMKSKLLDIEKWTQSSIKESLVACNSTSELSSIASENSQNESFDISLQLEHMEELLIKLNNSRTYRRTVGSVVGLCLATATPLLASVNEAASLVALDIAENGIATLAKVEEAYRYEKETKECIGRAIELCSLHDLQDAVNSADEGADENRLLPAMNKIWPSLINCLKHENPVATVRCLGVVSSAVQVCGGDFFTRRFRTDGAHFWKLLTTSPFHKSPISRGKTIQLPYRGNASSSKTAMAEVSYMKLQSAALSMIADISRNQRSASAFEAVLKKLCGLVVGIACSGVAGLRDASLNALGGLLRMDSDLVWLLLADVYYSFWKASVPSPPSADFAEVAQFLPPPSSSKDYLYVQYGGETLGFDIDPSSAELVFTKLQPLLAT